MRLNQNEMFSHNSIVGRDLSKVCECLLGSHREWYRDHRTRWFRHLNLLREILDQLMTVLEVLANVMIAPMFGKN